MEGTATAGTIRYREALGADAPAMFTVFRRAIWDYFERINYFHPERPDEPPIDSAWPRLGPMFEHLAQTAARAWVAEDGEGRIVGYARATERDDHVELTEFFVLPGIQTRGTGRELLRRAFPLDWGRHRSILATFDSRALRLYLEAGVRPIATLVSLVGRADPAPVETDLVFATGGDDAATVRAILAIERDVIGHARAPDVAFLLRTKPVVLALRRGRVVGYAFGWSPMGIGPIAVLDETDLAATIAEVERRTFESDADVEIDFLTSFANDRLVRHLLSRGYRIDPFWTHLLADEPFIDVSRYVFTDPPLIL